MRFVAPRFVVPAIVFALYAQAQIPPVPAIPPAAGGKVWTDAPVSSIPAEQIAPSNRAGSDNAGPPGSTPFSGVPTGIQNRGDQVSPANRDTRTGDGQVLPNLSK